MECLGGLYVISAEDTMFKIGRGDPIERFKAIANMNPFPWTLSLAWGVKLKIRSHWWRERYQIDLEKDIHNELDKYRCHGEWFEAPPLDINFLGLIKTTVKNVAEKAEVELIELPKNKLIHITQWGSRKDKPGKNNWDEILLGHEINYRPYVLPRTWRKNDR